MTVQDSGNGIPEELLSDIFEVFIQVDEPLNRSEEGLGLGLAIGKDLVQLHGGEVFAKNRKGGGLQVTFTLPIVK
jgi:two-component system sensor histidine kinase VicK